MSATTQAVPFRPFARAMNKSAEGREPTLDEKERRTKWDKQIFILADIHPPSVFWFE